MTKTQNNILQFLSKFKSSTEEQLKLFTKCSEQDINYLITTNLIVKEEKTKLLHLKMKKADIRTAVALDVVKMIKDNIKSIEYSRHFPVIFTIITKNNLICDIAVVRSIEQDTVFKKLKTYTTADKIIIVLESKKYNKDLLNTNKEVLICSYPLQIIDKIN